MAINNLVKNSGLLQAPKTSQGPINWGALNLKPVTQVTPTTTSSYSTPSPTPQRTVVSTNPVTTQTYSGSSAPTGNSAFNEPVRGLFGNVAQSLANTSIQGSPALNSITSQLQNQSSTASPEYSQAYKDAQAFNKALQESMRNEARGTATLLKQAIPLGDQEGQARVLQDQYLKEQQALASGFQGASNLISGANTQQQIQQQGLTSAGGLAQGAQTLAQSGLGTAGSLAQPTGNFPFVFDPSTGGFTNAGGGVVTPQEAASAVLSGKMTYQQAQQSLGYLGQVGDSQLQQAIIASGGNPLQLQSQGLGQQTVLQQIPQLEAANVAAEGVKNKINSYLSANPQLNQNALAAANLAQQWIQGKQLTDPKYQTLFNYLNEYTNTLAPILGVGGNVTNLKTEIAQGFVNAAASGESISQVLDAMSRLSTGKIQDMKSGALGGGVVSPSGANQITTQAADGKTYGFYQDANGVWHAQ